MALVKLLGSKLQNKAGPVDTAQALQGKKAVAVYFSAHWCPPCRGFTPKLAEWYAKDLQTKGLEVVFASSDRDEAAFSDYFKDMPWLALPFAEREVKNELSKKYKVSGIPALIILSPEGEVISTDGRGAVSADPTGAEFPWVPKTLSELLDGEYQTKDGHKPRSEVIGGKTVGLYFSAHWCPPCRAFTPQFAEVYAKVKADKKDFEVVFCSSDRDDASFAEYYSEMPWAALPFADRKRKEALARHFECSGIPMLVVLDEDLNVVNKNAVGSVRGDAAGAGFPWAPALVKDVDADCDGIDDAPSVVVLQAAAAAEVKKANRAVLLAAAERVRAAAKASGGGAEFNFFYADGAGEISGRVASECGVEKFAANTQGFAVVLMDIEDNGGFYYFEGKEFDAESLTTFLGDYKAKKLTRKQMGE